MGNDWQANDMNGWYQLLKGALGTYVRVLIRKVVLLGEVDLHPGPKIIVGNHPNASDGFTLLPTIKEHLHFAVMGDVFTLPFIGMILKNAKQIPTYRKQAERFVRDAGVYLAQGEPVVIFPEGKLNMDTGIRKAGLGAARLSNASGAPLLPIGIHVPSEHIRIIKSHMFGRDTVGSWQFGGKIYLNFGASFHLPVLPAGDERENLQKQTQFIMDRISELAEEAREFALRQFGQQPGLVNKPNPTQSEP
jgi:1-acyl-sn-glycerol-3-phosphate acyltransferase